MKKILVLLFTILPLSVAAETTHDLNWANGGGSANQRLTIDVGDTVRWTWGSGNHNLRSISGIENFNSGYSSDDGNVFSYTFNQPGITSYQCDPHAGNMNGSITVTASTDPTTPPITEDTFQLSLGEPINGQIHSGIGNLRGWAVSSNRIDRVEIFIDGKYVYNAPYGGLRVDVEAAFPNIDGSVLSGYSLAFGYADLGPGLHTVRAVAYDSLGNSTEQSSTFTVVVYDKNFINSNEVVDLSASAVVASGDEIMINDASIGQRSYNLKLKWRTGL